MLKPYAEISVNRIKPIYVRTGDDSYLFFEKRYVVATAICQFSFAKDVNNGLKSKVWMIIKDSAILPNLYCYWCVFVLLSPATTKFAGNIEMSSVRLSVCPSVRPGFVSGQNCQT